MLRTALPLLLALSLAGSEATDRALAEWDREALRAKQALDAALTRADERAVKAYQNAARTAARAGDHAAAIAAWRAVLTINRADPAAREYFAATGALDEVLALLDQPVDLFGNPVATTADTTLPADAPAIVIGAGRGQEHTIGSLRAGQQVRLQYLSGTWTPRSGVRAANPDAVNTAAELRLVISDGVGPEDAVLAVVPAGTAKAPHRFTAPRAIARAVLRVQPDAAGTGSGLVRYRIEVAP